MVAGIRCEGVMRSNGSVWNSPSFALSILGHEYLFTSRGMRTGKLLHVEWVGPGMG